MLQPLKLQQQIQIIFCYTPILRLTTSRSRLRLEQGWSTGPPLFAPRQGWRLYVLVHHHATIIITGENASTQPLKMSKMQTAIGRCQWVVFLKRQNNSSILFRRGVGLALCPNKFGHSRQQCTQLHRVFTDMPIDGRGDCGILSTTYCAWGTSHHMTSPNVSYESYNQIFV